MSSDGHQGSGGYDQSSASQSGAAAPDPMLGEVLDARYRITDRLGEGGMGEVYAAEHVHISKRVAIKLLRKEIVTNEEAVARFRQEARSASEIGHENIIKIEDFGELADGRIYLCMELLDGEPLNDLIREQELPSERLLDILIQTCHGLGAAHRAGVIHRDMKPENIFVTRTSEGRDVPKLLDFGIAKVSGADGQNHLTRTGTIFGTPFYMAPEQALGQAVDHRADVYAVGVIMYEVFTGSIPFSGDSFMGILTKHITAEPKPPAEMAAEHGRALPVGIDQVIGRAMKKEPGERYQTMEEMVEALVAVRRGVAGAGMSSYMEAHQPPGGMTPPPIGGGMPVAGMPAGGQHPTPPPPGYSAPMGPTPMPAGPASAPYQAHPSGGYPPGPASASYFAEAPKKSKAGLIALLIIVLAVAGGGTAFFLISQQRKGEESASNDQGETGEGGDQGAGDESSAGAGKVGDAEEDAGANAGEQGAGGDEQAVGQGEKGEGTAEAAGKEDAGAAQVVPATVRVLVKSSPGRARAYRDGKALGKQTPFLLEVKAGEPIALVLKRHGFKDAEISVDGKQPEVDVDLDRIHRANHGDHGGGGKPVAFCDRPENKNKVQCLPKNDCRRPENKNTTRCVCKRNPNAPVCALE